MINLGLPFETVVSTTQLDPDKVKALYQKRKNNCLQNCLKRFTGIFM
jgi:hypothetical protein